MRHGNPRPPMSAANDVGANGTAAAVVASEFMEDELEKLPVLAGSRDAPDVIRDEVFCSKIYHTNSTNQTRFTWLPTYARIMEHAGVQRKDGPPYPRPLTSPFPCFQCHMHFDGPPVFLPITALNGDRTEWGNFCDPACVNTYLHRNMNDANTAGRVADLIEYCQDVHGFKGSELGFAPHFSERAAYGGALTDAAFREVTCTPGLRTFERMAPFIPTPVVVEWQCHVEERGTDAADTALRTAVAAAAGVGTSIETLARLSGTATKPVEARGVGAVVVPVPPADLAPPSSATEALNQVLGMRPDNIDYHFWEVRGLRQPSQEDIEKRLRALPRPEKKTGLYELYCARKQNEDASSDEEDVAAAAKAARPVGGSGMAAPPAAVAGATTASKKRKAPTGGATSAARRREPPPPKEREVLTGTATLDTRVIKRSKKVTVAPAPASETPQ